MSVDFLFLKEPSSKNTQRRLQKVCKLSSFEAAKPLFCQEGHDSRILLARDRGLRDFAGVEISLTCSVPFSL